MNKHRKILVVEDEAPLQKAVQLNLKTIGIDSVAVKSVDEAVEALSDESIDLIWLDHYLQGKGTGVDLLKTMKQNEQWARIPVILVSNTASEPRLQEYRQLGVHKCYVKADHSLDEIVKVAKMLLKYDK